MAGGFRTMLIDGCRQAYLLQALTGFEVHALEDAVDRTAHVSASAAASVRGLAPLRLFFLNVS